LTRTATCYVKLCRGGTGGNFDVVYTSADVMALGAIQALEAAGIAVGGEDGVI
jgi:ABC-type sugar transport system substrate-binding protein